MTMITFSNARKIITAAEKKAAEIGQQNHTLFFQMANPIRRPHSHYKRPVLRK
jgi:hypothetical protein